MVDGESIRLSGIIFESLTNGPGMRRVYFSQGCSHNCKGCFNPHTHSFLGGTIFDIMKLVEDVVDNPLVKGITFSGGDPFEQSGAFKLLAKAFKERGYNIWSYSGYTFEELMKLSSTDENVRGLLSNIDVLVDGMFDEKLMDSKLKFRGSSNQRIIDVKQSMKLNTAVDISSAYDYQKHDVCL